MAGLNDGLDEEFLDEPNTNPASPPEQVAFAAAIDSNSEQKEEVVPSAEEIFGPGTVPGQLPNLKTEFVILNDRKNNISDFVSKIKDISTRGTISQEDARVLDAIQPGFITNKRSIQYYTNIPTQTQLVTTMSESSRFIEEQTNNLNKDYSELVKKISIVLDETIKNVEITKEDVDCIHEQTIDFIDSLWVKVELKASRFYLTSTHKLSDLLEASIDNIDASDYTTSLDLSTAFDELAKYINENKAFVVDVTDNGVTTSLNILTINDFTINNIVNFHKTNFVNTVEVILNELILFKNKINDNLTVINETDIFKVDSFKFDFANYEYFIDKLTSYENSATRVLNFNTAFLNVLTTLYKKTS